MHVGLYFATFVLLHKTRVINLSSGKEEVGWELGRALSADWRKLDSPTSYRISFVIFPSFLFFLDNMFFDILSNRMFKTSTKFQVVS